MLQLPKNDPAEAYAIAERRIAQIGKERSPKLNLSGLGLESLPPTIGCLSALRDLDLDNNNLTALPPEIGLLKNLTTLQIQNNCLTTLPAEIGLLTELTALLLSVNQLTSLPLEIRSLTNLQVLVLNNNRLTFLPPQIGALTKLVTLQVSQNQLTSLPSKVSLLRNLAVLGLDDNQLISLPPEIGSLSGLRLLFLQNNQLDSLPPEICSLINLSHLFIHGNFGLRIPDSVCGPAVAELIEDGRQAAKPQDILNFYFGRLEAAEAGKLQAVREIKVMLVGRGGAGKTSLRRFFLGQPHDAEEKETPGIALNTFPFACEQGNLTVRLWDFAGQEITHALHQFFLTEGCVYLLVLDPRSNTEMQDAEYWLGLLQRYAGNSPVLVVLNRQDSRQGGYEVDRFALMERFPLIHSFTPTNCASRHGCNDLLDRLRESIEVMPQSEPPHLQVPEIWLNIMRDCSQSSEKRQHMTFDEFRGICAIHGEKESDKQESLARLLHKLGTVLHFVEDPRLRDTSVLDPHWVTDGVYRLLRLKDRPKSDGVLSLADSMEALPREDERDVRFLLRLMERFEMCFPLADDIEGMVPVKWLVPGALDQFQPAGITDTWQHRDSVRLRYVYDPLPEGVLPRFIVRTHLLSEQQPRWRNGVVVKDGASIALVRRGSNRNHVEITAIGPPADRLRLLQIIQGNFEAIHIDLPEPKPFPELELENLPGIYRRMDDLEAAELRKTTVAVRSGRNNLIVEPTPELNRTSEQEARTDERRPLRCFLSYSHKDKRAKQIFQDNLTVMQQKNLVTTWHDGLIEPGMLWEEEIKDNLERMDVFVGLLTTAFLASGFIQTVELRAARHKRQKEGSDFLFVLIQVDDISLAGLNVSEYQIMRPSGKPVSKHNSLKAGFNEAQKELEDLIRKRQRVRSTEPSWA